MPQLCKHAHRHQPHFSHVTSDLMSSGFIIALKAELEAIKIHVRHRRSRVVICVSVESGGIFFHHSKPNMFSFCEAELGRYVIAAYCTCLYNVVATVAVTGHWTLSLCWLLRALQVKRVYISQ